MTSDKLNFFGCVMLFSLSKSLLSLFLEFDFFSMRIELLLYLGGDSASSRNIRLLKERDFSDGLDLEN